MIRCATAEKKTLSFLFNFSFISSVRALLVTHSTSVAPYFADLEATIIEQISTVYINYLCATLAVYDSTINSVLWTK